MRQASGDMERVIQLADEIIGSGEFVLEATFADVFNPSNDYLPGRELIFSRALNTAALTEIPGRSNYFSYRVFNGAIGTGGVVYYVSDDTGEHYARLLDQDARHIHTWDTVSTISGNPPVEVRGN